MKGLDNDVFYVFLILAEIFVVLGVLSNVQLITLPELHLPQIIPGGEGGASCGSSTVTVPIIWEVEWGASSVRARAPLSIIIGGESFTSIRATAILDYKAQGTIIGSEILDKMQLLFDGVVKKQIPFTLPENSTPPVTIGILEVTASEIAVWDKGAYATHILAFNIPAGGTFTVNFASGTMTTTNIEASSSNVTLTVPSQGNIKDSLTLKYATDFENIIKTDPTTLSMSISHRFNLGSDNSSASMWVEGVDRNSGITPHSGSRCIGMEITSIVSDTRNEFNIVGLDSLVGSKLFLSVWLYLPENWSLQASGGNWYSLADPMFEYGPTYLPYWAIHICNPPSFNLAIDTRGLDGKIVSMDSTSLDSVVRDPPAYPLPRGRWFNLGYYVLRSSTSGVADGAVKVWIDGKVVCDLSGVVTSGEGDWGTSPAKIYGSLTQAYMPYKIWVDDLAIYGPS